MCWTLYVSTQIKLPLNSIGCSIDFSKFPLFFRPGRGMPRLWGLLCTGRATGLHGVPGLCVLLWGDAGRGKLCRLL